MCSDVRVRAARVEVGATCPGTRQGCCQRLLRGDVRVGRMILCWSVASGVPWGGVRSLLEGLLWMIDQISAHAWRGFSCP